jgi:hypothetical protein
MAGPPGCEMGNEGGNGGQRSKQKCRTIARCNCVNGGTYDLHHEVVRDTGLIREVLAELFDDDAVGVDGDGNAGTHGVGELGER